jgi:hypothetical protein
LLPIGWLFAAIGYYGPWIAHQTAALTLTGIDMAEFVKFLPGVLDGSLHIIRQLFYLPPLAATVGVALLVGSPSLRYPWPIWFLALVLAVPVSLQLLPPAWSPASLMAAEFRLQVIALGLCWLLLASTWLLVRLPSRLSASVAALLASIAAVSPTWQIVIARPAITEVYGRPPDVGWGLYVCLAGLVIMVVMSTGLAIQPPSNTRPWSR